MTHWLVAIVICQGQRYPPDVRERVSVCVHSGYEGKELHPDHPPPLCVASGSPHR